MKTNNTYKIIFLFFLCLTLLGFSQKSLAKYSIKQEHKQIAENENQILLQKISRGVEQVAKKANKALAFISIYHKVDLSRRNGYIDPFEFFFGRQQRQFRQQQPRQPKQEESVKGGLGSGFIIDVKNGYILTNNHVVQTADEIKVKLANGKTYDAKVVGRDKKTDVAVIQIKNKQYNKTGISNLPLGNSKNLHVGDFVVALGAPYGLEASLSFGIVSAKGRGNLNISGLGDFIQTDAAINPGNSGGPLINMSGQVVGINTAIYSKSGGYAGIGFAVPSNLVKNIAEQLINNGGISRGFLGVQPQEVDKELAKSLKLPKDIKGALIAKVLNPSPSQKAGVEAGDVVVKVDEIKITSARDLLNSVGLKSPGQKVKLTIYRNAKKIYKFVTLSKHPDDVKNKNSKSDSSNSSNKNNLGMTLSKLNSKEARKYNLSSNYGVIVTKIKQDSMAYRSGIRVGDLILKINSKKIRNVKDVKKILRKKNRRHLIWLERDSDYFFLSLAT